MNYEDIKTNPNLIKHYRSRQLVPLICMHCQQEYTKVKHNIQINMRSGNKNYCSRECQHKSQITSVEVTCKQCNKSITRRLSDIEKTNNSFCSQSCAATYNNTNKKKKYKVLEIQCKQCNKIIIKNEQEIKRSKNNFCSHSCSFIYAQSHKTHGTNRSKLEVWLEEKLPKLYPSIDFLFNDRTTIKSELDIYIPTLQLAFELNGIFHYEQVYGLERLKQIQDNDTRKFMLCQQHNINLCLIDTSSQKRFTEQSSQKFLDIITKIIDDCINHNDLKTKYDTILCDDIKDHYGEKYISDDYILLVKPPKDPLIVAQIEQQRREKIRQAMKAKWQDPEYRNNSKFNKISKEERSRRGKIGSQKRIEKYNLTPNTTGKRTYKYNPNKVYKDVQITRFGEIKTIKSNQVPAYRKIGWSKLEE